MALLSVMNPLGDLDICEEGSFNCPINLYQTLAENWFPHVPAYIFYHDAEEASSFLPVQLLRGIVSGLYVG